jgi:hypothetical protein
MRQKNTLCVKKKCHDCPALLTRVRARERPILIGTKGSYWRSFIPRRFELAIRPSTVRSPGRSVTRRGPGPRVRTMEARHARTRRALGLCAHLANPALGRHHPGLTFRFRLAGLHGLKSRGFEFAPQGPRPSADPTEPGAPWVTAGPSPPHPSLLVTPLTWPNRARQDPRRCNAATASCCVVALHTQAGVAPQATQGRRKP